MMLCNNDILKNWSENEIEIQCMWWYYCERRMLHIMQSRKIFINYDFKLNTFLSNEFLTNQLYFENDVLWC